MIGVLFNATFTQASGLDLKKLGKTYDDANLQLMLKSRQTHVFKDTLNQDNPSILTIKTGVMLDMCLTPEAVSSPKKKYMVFRIRYLSNEGMHAFTKKPLSKDFKGYMGTAPFGLKLNMSVAELEEKIGKVVIKDENGNEYQYVFIWRLPQFPGLSVKFLIKDEKVIGITYGVYPAVITDFKTKVQGISNLESLDFRDAWEVGKRLHTVLGNDVAGNELLTITDMLERKSSMNQVYQHMVSRNIPTTANVLKLIEAPDRIHFVYCTKNISSTSDFIDALVFNVSASTFSDTITSVLKQYIRVSHEDQFYLVHPSDQYNYQWWSNYPFFMLNTVGTDIVTLDVFAPSPNALLHLDGNSWLKLMGIKQKDKRFQNLLTQLDQYYKKEVNKTANIMAKVVM